MGLTTAVGGNRFMRIPLDNVGRRARAPSHGVSRAVRHGTCPGLGADMVGLRRVESLAPRRTPHAGQRESSKPRAVMMEEEQPRDELLATSSAAVNFLHTFHGGRRLDYSGIGTSGTLY